MTIHPRGTTRPGRPAGPAADLEHDLARARPRLLDLAAQLATGGTRGAVPDAELVAAALESLASLAGIEAARLRGEQATR